MMHMIIRFVANAVAIWLTTYVISGVNFESWQSLLLMTLVLGFVNAVIRPIIRLISLPITIISLGIFNVVINAGMLVMAAFFVPGFSVENFWSAILFSIVLSIISTIIGWFVK